MNTKKKLRQILIFLQRENLHTLALWVFILVIFSAVLVTLLEPNMSLVNAVWWSIVTLTTVGYGDFSPTTGAGRFIAVIIMFFGIGLLGMLSATLATLLISRKMKENKGMSRYSFENHIILCEWNHRSQAILHEFRGDSHTAETPIILIAEIDEKPEDDPDLFFIKGNVSEETLEKANLEKAKTVVVLGDDRLEKTARDAKVVLSTLTIESLYPEVYTVVELVDEANVHHCKRAHADEIIVGSELSSHLIASSAINHGISRVVSELLSSQYGNELYSIPIPNKMADCSFIEIFTRMKKEFQSIVLGVQKGSAGELIANPPVDYRPANGDYLIVIARERPAKK